MKASPSRWPLFTNSMSRRVPVGELGLVIREEKCPVGCPEHDRFWVEFSDGEIIEALRGYFDFFEEELSG